jgi:predicted solute-binding protein
MTKVPGSRALSDKQAAVLKEALPSSKDIADMSDEAVEERMNLLGVAHDKLDTQSQRFVMLYCSGMTYAAAGNAVGIDKSKIQRFANSDKIQHAIRLYRKEQKRAVDFTREDAHAMYMDAFATSDNATEKKNVVDSLVKLHDVAKRPDPTPRNQVNIQINATQEQLQSMPDDALLRIIGMDEGALTPTREDDVEDAILIDDEN